MEANEFGTVFFVRERGVNERASSMRCGFQEIRFRIRFAQGGQPRPGSINGVGSHEIGSGFNSRKVSCFESHFTTLF